MTSLGIYLPHSLNDDVNDYLDVKTYLLNNIYRHNVQSNIFKWEILFDYKIKNILSINLNMISLSKNPFLDKDICNNFDKNILDFLKNTKLIIDIIYNISHYQLNICYFDDTFIDFILNLDSDLLYSYNIIDNIVYKFSRSTKSIYDQNYLYINLFIDNNIYDTGNSRNFSFKLTQHIISKIYENPFIHFKSHKQIILKTLNTLINIDRLKIELFDNTFTALINDNVNKKLYNTNIIFRNCINESYIKPSCYCNYIRHPYNKHNKIDIVLKIKSANIDLVR